ncbi:MAG: PIN domain nuclease of toxin-antitoxin system [Patiriisocius sp.]|jgi:PIN domain nuclease of toxin-antitoxin system
MIVLDTHTLLWWVSDKQKLSKKALNLVDREAKRGQVLVSSISTWEVAMLVKRSRLSLKIEVGDFVTQLENLPSIQFVPISNRVALAAVNLPDPLHKDPADRLIIATAKVNNCKLVTADAKILAYHHVDAVW